MSSMEAVIWLWLYMGMAIGLFSIAIVLWAIWFEYNNKE